MTKKKSLLSLILALCLCLALAVPALAAENESSDQIRMIDVENDLRQYLEVYKPDMVFGSQEFIEYAVGVFVYDEDSLLATLDNYGDIVFYLGEYLYQLDQAQTALSGISAYSQDSTFELSEQYKQQTLAEIKAEVAAEEKMNAESSANQEGIALYYSYNPSAAAAYAIKYGNRLSEDYPHHDADCTNFVSQAVHAGGIAMNIMPSHTNGITKTTQYWYCLKPSIPVNPWHESSSWVNVNDFYDYVTDVLHVAHYDELSSVAEVQQQANIGDVVQLGASGRHYSHSIFISGGSRGNYRYSAHTDNYSNRLLSLVSSKDRQFRIIHF